MTTTDAFRPRMGPAAACAAAALLLLLSGCGNANAPASASGQSYGQGGGSASGPDRRDGRPPGVSGKVAAVAGKTAQIQGVDGQVAVTWTGTTTFTKEVSAGLADVEVGRCVFVRPAQSTTQGSAPDQSPTSPTTVTAASVRITPKTDGTCGPGLRGPSGSGPRLQGPPPSGAPGGGTRPQVRAMGGAVGEVTAVSATGFTVASVMPSGNGDTQKTTDVTVTVTGETAYTATAAGSAADVKVGVCVTADGTADDTGAVTARTIGVSQPKDGQCGGLMRFQSGPGNGGGTSES